MAEVVVGVVASGISIASLIAQVANSVTKLKSYWDELKEAPEDIRLLIEEIEDLYLLLYDIEDDQRQNPMSSKLLDSASASRYLEHCKRGADNLKKLTEDLGDDMNAPDRFRRKWASAKVVFKKDKIEKYKARLERAIRLLSLSHQCYTRTLLQLQPDIIVSRISHTMHSIQNNNNAYDNPSTAAPNESSVTACQSHIEINESQDAYVQSLGNQHTTQISKRRVRKREELAARYRVSLWAMKWAWDVEFLRSRSGWTIRLIPTTIVPFNSPVNRAVAAGDLTRLRELFDRGQASISDRFEKYTLLDMAMISGNILIFRFLLDHGADPNEISVMIFAPVYYKCPPYEYHRQLGINAKIEFARLLVNDYDLELEVSKLKGFIGPKKAFLSLQQYTEVPYHEAPLEARAEVAMGLATNAPTNSPELFRIAFAMHPGPIHFAAIHYVSSEGETLLHAVANAIGATVIELSLTNSRDTKADLLGWRAILRELVTNGADLHAVLVERDIKGEKRPRTPLLNLFRRNYNMKCGSAECQYIDQPLKVWLEDLEDCGVDLLKYGRKEKALHDEIPMLQDFMVDFLEDGEFHEIKWRLIGFSFGASPSDWHIWISEPTDCFAGDFWSMIEPPEMSIPGMWME